jgi:hypothetical protein
MWWCSSAAILKFIPNWDSFYRLYFESPKFHVVLSAPFLLSSTRYLFQHHVFNVYIDRLVAIVLYYNGSLVSSSMISWNYYVQKGIVRVQTVKPLASVVHFLARFLFIPHLVNFCAFLHLLWNIASWRVISSWAVTGLFSAPLLFRAMLSLYLILVQSLISPYCPELVYGRNLARVFIHAIPFLLYLNIHLEQYRFDQLWCHWRWCHLFFAFILWR